MTNFSVLDWNVQHNLDYSGFTSLKNIKNNLLTKNFDIAVLQEIEASKLQDFDLLKNYEIVGEQDNTILSKFPIVKFEPIIFPSINNKTSLKSCLRTDIKINNKILRIYNCHFEIVNVGITTRLKQLDYILTDTKSHNGPTIICGDMNVTIPAAGLNRTIISLFHLEPKKEMHIDGKYYKGDERELFNKKLVENGFKEVLNLYTPTWSPFKTKKWEMFKLKLDWFATKNLSIDDAKLGDYISDHRSIEAYCQV